ncbi:hypothetical protein QF034_006482 [Streptomyces africanus]|uniref:Lipoprotein n=1 Tax=Streptomyces africanus TaxID=231024 RepID=A0ABU0QXY4_9ACTN|nr:hypothetical protein [Streptomyces africanus]MDQ0752251.1 hypothetical protein [Streptomyces africanus]
MNDQRRETALSSILRQARRTAPGTARALDAGGAAGTDALTGVVWQHTRAPVITYDPSRRAFTALVSRSAVYDEKGLFPGGGPVKVDRCLSYTYSRLPGPEWTSKVTVRDRDVCRPGLQISKRVALARLRIKNLYAEDLTRPGVRRALDPTGHLRYFEVEDAVRRGRTVTVTVLVRAGLEASAPTGQCYRFTRRVEPDGAERSVTAVPVAASRCRAA